MFNSGRRDFLMRLGALSLFSLSPTSLYSLFKRSDRKFKICLNPGAIGISVSQNELLIKAKTYGFEAMVPLVSELSEMNDGELDQLLSAMEKSKISWGCAGLPVQFRLSEARFKEDLAGLKNLVKSLKKAGGKSMSTWIMPTHKELTYRHNFKLHRERLGEVAKVLADHDIKLGLEYVGPKTLMARDKYSFIRTMQECGELMDSIDADNVGFQLDAFHWFCAGESVDDILALDPSRIITVDLNDARADRTPDEQLDWERELPGDSGIIDIEAFLKALVKIGYSGPVRAEPFNEELNNLKDEVALQRTIDAMRNVISTIE